MIGLIVVGFVAGLIAGISPCVLPVLPVVLVAGSTVPNPASASYAEDAAVTSAPASRRARRPLAVVLGLVVSFSLLVLVGSEVLSLLGLPQDFLRDAGIVILAVVGIGFVIPAVGRLLEVPFTKMKPRQPDGAGGGFVLGLALGLLFAPCAGPVLAAITAVGATHRVGWSAVFLTLAFSIGAAVPLLIVASAGQRITQRVRALQRRAPQMRMAGGAVLIAMALLTYFSAFDGLQRDLPGYTTALQNKVEGSTHFRKQLSSVTGNSSSSLASCSSTATTLIQCGAAPNFKGITAWLNTAGKSLSLPSLRGKVVLIDFWTYSCINCQRTLPHVEAWYQRYASDGLVVVGVETPEFAFEHVVSNVRTAVGQLGVRYPVAVDDDYATWDAYDNEYWPAEYLVDANGDVRHVSFGEGDYGVTENLIRQLLAQAHPGAILPPATDIPNQTPTEGMDPETYVGYDRLQYVSTENYVYMVENKPVRYQLPADLELGDLGFGGTWTERAEEATAGSGATLELHFMADDIYLVMGGTGTVQVSVNGKVVKTLHVTGIPDLYTLYQDSGDQTGTLLLRFSPGVQAYDFTFG